MFPVGHVDKYSYRQRLKNVGSKSTKKVSQAKKPRKSTKTDESGRPRSPLIGEDHSTVSLRADKLLESLVDTESNGTSQFDPFEFNYSDGMHDGANMEKEKVSNGEDFSSRFGTKMLGPKY